MTRRDRGGVVADDIAGTRDAAQGAGDDPDVKIAPSMPIASPSRPAGRPRRKLQPPPASVVSAATEDRQCQQDHDDDEQYSQHAPSFPNRAETLVIGRWRRSAHGADSAVGRYASNAQYVHR